MNPWSDEQILALEDLVGDMDHSKLMAILRLEPSFDEVLEAIRWAEHEGDYSDLGSIDAKVCHILAILTAQGAVGYTIH